MEWKEVTLGDVCNILTGFPFKGNKYSKDGIRVVRGDNVTIGSLRWDNEKDKRWNEPFDKFEQYSLRDNDIVIGMDGSRVGKNKARIRKEDLPLLLAQRVACLRSNEKAIQEYLYYNVFCDRFIKYVDSIHTGSAIPHISQKQIGDFTLALPSLSYQRRIVSILSSLDNKIETNNKINANLEEMAQAIFKNWFVDFAPFKDGKFVESELGMIPEGWRVGTLSEVADITSGKRPPKKSKELSDECNIPLIGAADIMGYTSSILYQSPILIIGRVGTHGVVQRWKDSCWPSDNTLVIESKYYNYTYQQLKCIDYSSINRGSTQPLITQTDVKNTSIIIPTDQVLDKYESLVDSLYNFVYKNNQENQHLASIRDTLLPRLMSGEIEV